MEKSTKNLVSAGFDQGFDAAVDIIRALAPTMEMERDRFVMENLVKVLSENAKRENWLFFNRVTFETSENGAVSMTMKKTRCRRSTS